jgi:sugar phosphate isomerase/epimerase
MYSIARMGWTQCGPAFNFAAVAIRNPQRNRPMEQEYSLAHLTVLGCPPPEMTYIAARAGYDYISPRFICMGLPGEPDYEVARHPQMLRDTRRALAATGVRVHDIELARILDDTEPAGYLHALDAAAELGARAVLSSIWTERRDFAVDRFGELCDLAAGFGLTVDLEPVPVAGVATIAQAADVLRRVGRANAGLMVDMHHFHRGRNALETLDELPRSWFHFAHLCDAGAAIPSDRAEMLRVMRGGRLYPGEGGIAIAAILERLPQVVYSLEVPHLARVREIGYAEHAFRCLAHTKAYLARHAVRPAQAPLPAGRAIASAVVHPFRSSRA